MSEWISVKDRLPEKHGKYLVHGGNRIKKYTFILRYYEGSQRKDGTRRLRWASNNIISSKTILFWMELPNPPEDK